MIAYLLLIIKVIVLVLWILNFKRVLKPFLGNFHLVDSEE